MQRPLSKKIFGKLPIFVGLLFCLCVSRGEGLHLLPFSDSSDHLSFSSSEFKTTSTKYQFSTHSQNGFDGKFQSKNLKNSSKNPFVPIAFASYKTFAEKPDGQNSNFETKPKITRSKFLLTAVSDRAPPCLNNL